MLGRATGEAGNWKAAEYVAAEFRRLGLEPGGENGTYFQTVPFRSTSLDEARTRFAVNGENLAIARDFYPMSALGTVPPIAGARVVLGGVATDRSSWIGEEDAAGKFVVLTLPADQPQRRVSRFALRQIATRTQLARAAGIIIPQLDRVGADGIAAYREAEVTLDAAAPGLRLFMVSDRVLARLLGADPATLRPGALGGTVDAVVASSARDLPFAARNVIGIVRGTDAALNRTYVSLSAHNDHEGFTRSPVDHDSLRAYNRVVRPGGADSPNRPATAEEWARIRTILDSLRRVRPPRPDSIYNGADDDGSGTVGLVEVAERLAAGPRPRRSILLISHAAEEMGLVGSRWFTDHPTVPIDSIIGEIDMDMVGRGPADAAPNRLEMIGWRRNSQEFGDVLARVNARQAMPWNFNLEYDAPGHPMQYYCRADHFMYARHNIPSASISRGGHQDYHQLSDEAQYIDYDVLSRVAQFVHDAAVEVANMDHRPKTERPKGDPNAPCRQ